MIAAEFNNAWFALQVRYGSEKVVALMLQQKGYLEFLPLYHVTRRWSDRIKKLSLPLFPGYVFCRFDASAVASIVSTPGVVRIVRAGKTPVPISDREIESLQTLVRSGLDIEPYSFVRVGESATIDAGPLCGLEGVIIRIKNSYRLIISVSLLQRSVAVEVDRDWLRATDRSLNRYQTRFARVANSFV